MNAQEKLQEELAKYPGQWFVINSQTGHEEKVKKDLIEKIKNNNLSNVIFDVRISKYEGETPSGKKTEKNKFPGYIFINMNMTEKAWFVVRNTPGVTGFIGSSGRGAKPFPLTDEEVAQMLIGDEMEKEQQAKAEAEAAEAKKAEKKAQTAKDGKKIITSGADAEVEKVYYEAPYKEGETVTILSGPMEGKEGKVTSLDHEKGIAVVSIEMFGRYTPTEVEFKNAKSIKED